jgi:hypothetical protein
MPAGRSRLRAPALMAAAALALHQLRYLLAPAEAAERAEHAYVPFAAMLIVLLFALAAGQLSLRVAIARDEGKGEAEPRAFRVVWLTSSAGLVAIFGGQELLEAVLAGGSAGDPLSGGNFVALPLACVLGALVALALRWAGGAVRAAIRRLEARSPRPRPVLRPVWRPGRPPASVLARNLAGRAPPLPS